MYGALRVGYLKKIDVVTSLILTVICTNIITYFQVSLIDRGLVSVRPMLVLTVLDIIISIIWTFVSAWAYSKLYQPRKMLIV